MNSVTGRKKQPEPPKASLKGRCDTFGAIVSDLSRPERLRPTQGPMPQGTFDVFKPVSVNNVCVMLQTVNPVKATGSDGIPGLVLKSAQPPLPHPLLVSSTLP